MKPGDRVRVTEHIVKGVGDTPKPGDMGRLERQLPDGTVVVNLDSGKRALLASWEVEIVQGGEAN